MAVPAPVTLAEVVGELPAGADLGMVCAPLYPEHAHGPTRGRARVLAALARHALPQPRRWPRST